MSKFDKKFLIFLFLFSFLIRTVFFILLIKDNPVMWQFDSAVYKNVAEQILLNKGIVNLDGSPHFYRVPGYSIFLAITSFAGNFNYSLFFQLVLASFIPILIFLLSKQIFTKSRLLPYVAALFASIHLGFILFSGLVMTESIFTILFLLFFYFFFLSARKRSRIKSGMTNAESRDRLTTMKYGFNKNKIKFEIDNVGGAAGIVIPDSDPGSLFSLFKNLFIAGLFLGLASMFRPVGHYLIFVSILVLLFSKNSLKDKFKNSLKLLTSWFLMVLPWLLRNFIFTGLIFFTTLPGIHFLKHSAARIYMQVNKCSYISALNNVSKEWQDSILEQEIKQNKKLNEAEQCSLAQNLSFNYLLKNLKLSFIHAFKNMFKTCFSLYSSELLFLDSGGKLPEYSYDGSFLNIIKRFLFPKLNNKFLIFFIYLEILLFVFLLIGFVGFIFNSLFYEKYRFILLQILPFILLFVFISFSCGFARLRLPIEPFLILLSIEFWLKFFKERKLIFYE